MDVFFGGPNVRRRSDAGYGDGRPIAHDVRGGGRGLRCAAGDADGRRNFLLPQARHLLPRQVRLVRLGHQSLIDIVDINGRLALQTGGRGPRLRRVHVGADVVPGRGGPSRRPSRRSGRRPSRCAQPVVPTEERRLRRRHLARGHLRRHLQGGAAHRARHRRRHR